MISVFVPGTPKTQGSTKAFAVKTKEGRVRAVVKHDNSPALGDWRATVRQHVAQRMKGEELFIGPVQVGVRFYLARPASATKRVWPQVKPDLDKLVRAVLDALKGTVYLDDNQVVSFGPTLDKVYAAPGAPTGARIWVEGFTYAIPLDLESEWRARAE